ncbi:alpha/beta hydrolase family protein [Ceratobasidium sp. AG-Ba]|nr:alpha/beta hydrolase family protein [Ceratobasidium sp. AG-Ba]QRW09061.1 alpha/beta hydrolase family protein [Ceratobasidium sp. AG-Ba]
MRWPEKIRLRVVVFLIRSYIRVNRCFQNLFGTRPYYTHFPPNQSFTVNSNTSSRRIKINVYEPSDLNRNKSYPVYINLHASGFIIPALGMDGDFCRIVSNRTGAIVLDCDYAKAPEWPFPAAPDDLKDVISHVLDNKEGIYDTTRLAVGGFSAGGVLALTAPVSQPENTIKGIIAFYPLADFSLSHADRFQPGASKGEDPNISPSFMELVNDCYCPTGTDLSDPRLSPVNVPVSLFPKHIFIAVCGYDPLRKEAVGLADKLKGAGVGVVFQDLPNVPHAWDKQAKEKTHGGTVRHNSYEAAIKMLKHVFNG